jgi:hypothetical protein
VAVPDSHRTERRATCREVGACCRRRRAGLR